MRKGMADPPQPSDAPDDRVAFVNGLKASAKQVKRAAFDSYVDQIASRYAAGRAEVYEWLTNLRIGIVYFDVDAVRGDTTEAALLARCKQCLRDFFGDVPDYDFERQIVTATSHGAAKWSFRFYNASVVATPKDIKKRIQLLNLSVPLGGVFDEAVYGSQQKLRAVGSIKTPEDARQLRLVGVPLHDDDALRSALARTVIQQVPPDATRLPEPVLPPRSHKRKAAPVAAGPAPPPVKRVARTGGRRPTDAEKPELARLLQEAGFGCVTFHDNPRERSLTFQAINHGEEFGTCPCCAGTHERHNWWVWREPSGCYTVRSYSTSCKPLSVGAPTTVFVEDPADTTTADTQVVEVRRDLQALTTQVDGLTRDFRKFVNDVAPAITAEHEAAIDPQTIVQSGNAFQFNYTDPAIPDQPYTCSSLVGPTAELYSSRQGAVRTIINLAMEVPTLRLLVDNPDTDAPYADWFQLQTGLLGQRWIYDPRGARFYSNSGALWTPAADSDVKSLFQKLARQSFSTLYYGALNIPEDAVIPHRDHIVKGLKRCHAHVLGDGYTKRFVEAAKTHLHDASFHERLDAATHLLGAPNGVIDLRTGALVDQPQDSCVSMCVRVAYAGLEHPTPVIDAWVASLFDGDLDLAAYVQRWMGYCVTGETRAQKFAVFAGSGSNGKSLLVETVAHLLQGLRPQCPRLRLLRLGAGQRQQLNPLHGGFAEEAPGIRRRDLGADGRSTCASSSRSPDPPPSRLSPCTRTPFTMRITHKQILATNEIPKLDLSEYSLQRRIVIIPFKQQFRPADKLDAGNPAHRLRDDDLKMRLESEEVQQELLTWLAIGAQSWYTSSSFDAKPSAVVAAEREYVADTDFFGNFLSDNTTRQDGGLIWETELSQRLGEVNVGGAIGRQMENRGYRRFRKRHPETGKVKVAYAGLTWTLLEAGPGLV